MQSNDPSVQSVIEYAVGTLKVEHSGNYVVVVVVVCFADVTSFTVVVICGHSSCGGVEAAWKASRGVLDHSLASSRFIMQWLAPLVQLSKDLGLDLEPDKDKALPILTAESVKRQVLTVTFV